MDFTGVKSFFKLTIVSSKDFILFKYESVTSSTAVAVTGDYASFSDVSPET
jgi:hypothetical protein